MTKRRVLFVFLDGVGIGSDDAGNPTLSAELPVLTDALGRLPTLSAPRVEGRDAVAFPLDATLGVPGTPQSGTGQTALLTGKNAPRRFGRHFGPWVPVSLRETLARESLLSRATADGHGVAFANAYPKGWPGKRTRRPPAFPFAARAAGLLTRHHESLGRGEAVASEIVNDGWRSRLGFTELPDVIPIEAGRNLARVSREADLTVFAHYSTDHAGHERSRAAAERALERVDAFLGGVLEGLDDALLMVASDHGNVEDPTTGHTTNPALGLLFGPDAAARSRGLEAITDVAGAVEGWLRG